jgi:glycine betaine/proline transport system substrate-binding protein
MAPMRALTALMAFAVALTLLVTAAAAQDSPSVETLGPPGPVSSGAMLPGEEADGADGVAPEAAPPPPCGTEPLNIASMQWPSAQILAEIHARILAQAFGCAVKIVPGDMAATGSSMETSGQPAVAPELWITRIAEIWNAATKAQKVRQAGVTYDETTLEGWFIPDYVATAHPELRSAADIAAHPEIFAGAGAKGRFISCPPDWGCAVINRNLLAALGLADAFDVVEPGNRFQMDTMIAEAVSRREPVLFYYWEPNAVLAQFGFKRVDLGPYDHDALQCLAQRVCVAPKPSAFAPEPVIIALSDWVFSEAPEVAAYFQRARMPVKEMDALLAALSENGATAQSVAARFVTTRRDVWQRWVGAPVAAAPAQ